MNVGVYRALSRRRYRPFTAPGRLSKCHPTATVYCDHTGGLQIGGGFGGTASSACVAEVRRPLSINGVGRENALRRVRPAVC